MLARPFGFLIHYKQNHPGQTASFIQCLIDLKAMCFALNYPLLGIASINNLLLKILPIPFVILLPVLDTSASRAPDEGGHDECVFSDVINCVINYSLTPTARILW